MTDTSFAQYGQNYHEIGGPDTPMLTSVANVFANLPGLISTALGTWLLRRTGSLLPLFGLTGALQFAAGVLFSQFAEVTPARELLAAKAK